MIRKTGSGNFDAIRNLCDRTSLINEHVVDDFIIPFAARHHELEKKMNNNFTRFRHILSMFKKSDVELFRSQYIAHEVFKKGGLIGAYSSFGPEDILFFATEKNPLVENESDVQKDIENDPLPYMMLMSGAELPRTFNKEDEVVIMMAEHEMNTLDTVSLKKKFISEYNDGVYRFTHKEFGEHPHFAQFYYDENEKLLLLQALTEAGFKHLIKDFNSFGYNIPDIAYLRVRLQMVAKVESILKKKIVLNEYEDLFKKDPDPLKALQIKKMNEFISRVLPLINEGLLPDIEEAARETGLDPETARNLVKMIMEKTEKVNEKNTNTIKKEPSGKEKDKSLKSQTYPDSYRLIYQVAKLICELEPWKDLHETEIFGVKMPGSGLIWFISVMGTNGEFTGIAAYKGYQGLFGFYSLQEETDNMRMTNLFTVPHVLISFTDRKDLDKKDLEAIKKSGVTFHGKGQWIKLEEVIPGFIPVFPGKEVLEDLAILLDQTLSVLLQVRKNPDLLYKPANNGDEILIRIPHGTGKNLNWKNHYEIPDLARANFKYNISYNKNSTEAVKKLKVSNITLQCDLALIPAPVKEPGRKGYFPFMLLLLEKSSGFAPGMNLLQPDPDLQSLYETVAQKLLEEILKLGYKPVKVEFRSELLFGLVKNILLQSGCTPVLVKNMPLMDDAIKSLFNNLIK